MDDDVVARNELSIPVDDWGFRVGATAVERLRTYHGIPWQIDLHAQRMRHSMSTIGVQPIAPERFRDRILRLLALQFAGRKAAADEEVGIVVVATPGTKAPSGLEPSVAGRMLMWLVPIDSERFARRRSEGSPIALTNVQIPPATSWDPQAKVRCRLHYYLADLEAQRHAPEAVGWLHAGDGLGDTSIASMAIVQDDTVWSPPPERLLASISQTVASVLAHRIGLPWRHRELSSVDIEAADEIWMMGTDTGLWHVNRVFGTEYRKPHPGPCLQRLRKEWDEEVRRSATVGLDEMR